MKLRVLLSAAAAAAQPYPALNGGAFSGPAVDSPDPLVRYRWGDSVNATQLQQVERRPVAVLSATPSAFPDAVNLTEGGSALVSGTGSLGLDFGAEHAAWIELDAPGAAAASATIYLSISEFNQPGFYNTAADGSANNKTALAQYVGNGTYRLVLNKEWYEGVRYGWVHVTSMKSSFSIEAVRLVCQILPVNYRGAVHAPGSLSSLWWVAAYTVKLNLMPGFFNSILIDRGDRISWTGDAHVAQRTALVAFGNWPAVRQNIERTSGPGGYNGIASYALYWVLSVADYYWYSGDSSVLEAHAAEMGVKLSSAFSFWDKPFALHFFGSDDRVGADFEFPDIPESQRAYRMLGIHAARAWAAAVAACSNCFTTLRRSARRWADVADQHSSRARSGSDWWRGYGLHSAAAAVNANVTTADEEAAMAAALFSNTANLCSFSPFNTYFILSALSRLRTTGAADAAASMLDECWGGQVRLGATTFWETYSPEWNTAFKAGDPTPNSQTGYMSRCHPWASGPAPFLTERMLGIKPELPGFRAWSVVPRLSVRYDAVVNGTVPTPIGEMSVAVSVGAATGTVQVRGPAGSVGYVGLPKLGKSITSVHVNGKPWSLAQRDEDEGHLYIRGLNSTACVYNITYTRAGAPAPQPPPPPRVYPGQFLGLDTATKGDWQHKYGADGYLMWSYDGAGKHRQLLPPYVASVAVRAGTSRDVHWVDGGADARALEDPDGTTRRLGALLTGNPAACKQSLVIDVNMTDGPREVSLYCVDFDHAGRTMAVEVHDLGSLNLAAPTQRLVSFSGGSYLRYKVTGAVRFRVMMITGQLPHNDADAAVSALFFG